MTNHKSIFVIVDNATGEFVCFNSKAAWTKRGNAKNAYNCAQGWLTGQRFDDQNEYSVVEITKEMLENMNE